MKKWRKKGFKNKFKRLSQSLADDLMAVLNEQSETRVKESPRFQMNDRKLVYLPIGYEAQGKSSSLEFETHSPLETHQKKVVGSPGHGSPNDKKKFFEEFKVEKGYWGVDPIDKLKKIDYRIGEELAKNEKKMRIEFIEKTKNKILNGSFKKRLQTSGSFKDAPQKPHIFFQKKDPRSFLLLYNPNNRKTEETIEFIGPQIGLKTPDNICESPISKEMNENTGPKRPIHIHEFKQKSSIGNPNEASRVISSMEVQSLLDRLSLRKLKRAQSKQKQADYSTNLSNSMPPQKEEASLNKTPNYFAIKKTRIVFNETQRSSFFPEKTTMSKEFSKANTQNNFCPKNSRKEIGLEQDKETNQRSHSFRVFRPSIHSSSTVSNLFSSSIMTQKQQYSGNRNFK